MSEPALVIPSGNADRPALEPFLRVVRGNPTPEEIAVLVVALLARDSDAAARPVRQPRSAWADLAHVLRAVPATAGPSDAASRSGRDNRRRPWRRRRGQPEMVIHTARSRTAPTGPQGDRG